MKFEIGDNAVHPAHGVGEVTSIEEKKIAGSAKHFYILKIAETGVTVMVPTAFAVSSTTFLATFVQAAAYF